MVSSVTTAGGTAGSTTTRSRTLLNAARARMLSTASCTGARTLTVC